jgi:hypothetical protein
VCVLRYTCTSHVTVAHKCCPCCNLLVANVLRRRRTQLKICTCYGPRQLPACTCLSPARTIEKALEVWYSQLCAYANECNDSHVLFAYLASNTQDTYPNIHYMCMCMYAYAYAYVCMYVLAYTWRCLSTITVAHVPVFGTVGSGTRTPSKLTAAGNEVCVLRGFTQPPYFFRLITDVCTACVQLARGSVPGMRQLKK